MREVVSPPQWTFLNGIRHGWTTWEIVCVATVVSGIAVFLALPWSLEGKALAALHGLCAQQPTHTLHFGDGRLPFDARMTGIYGGFACACGWFLARGRWRYGGIPSIGIALALAGFVVALGIDGVNSFLLDTGQWHLYEPRNEDPASNWVC